MVRVDITKPRHQPWRAPPAKPGVRRTKQNFTPFITGEEAHLVWPNMANHGQSRSPVVD